MLGNLHDMVLLEVLGGVSALGTGSEQRGGDLLDEDALEAGGHFTGLQRFLCRSHCTAALVAQHHDQRDAQTDDGELEGRQHGEVSDLTRGSDDEEVAEALVEDDLDGDPGVRTGQHHGEGALTGGHQLAPVVVLAGVGGILGHEPGVPALKSLESPLRDVAGVEARRCLFDGHEDHSATARRHALTGSTRSTAGWPAHPWCGTVERS